MSKCSKKSRNRQVISLILVFTVLMSVILSGCHGQSAEIQNKKFRKFTETLFCQEVSSNAVSLHYTLKNPDQYGITDSPVTFGYFSTDPGERKITTENTQAALKRFSYQKLSKQNQLTYDVLNYYLELSKKESEYLLYEEPMGTVSGVQTQIPVLNQLTYDVLNYYLELSKKESEYLLYEEPMGTVSGVQTQIPVLLSEYQFQTKADVDAYLELMKTTPEYFNSLIAFEQEKAQKGLFMANYIETKADVDAYLELMKTTPEYFNSLIAFEQEKAQKGLFMANYIADTVIEQCQAFLDMGNSNYLISTFVDRIQKLTDLSEEEKSDYIQKNAYMLQTYVLPAYQQLIKTVVELKESGKNEGGLCYLPNGKEYYALTVQASTGSARTVPELQKLTRQQIEDDLAAMKAVVGLTSDQAKETAVMDSSDPKEILNSLNMDIQKTFPELPQTSVEVKYVPEAMEDQAKETAVMDSSDPKEILNSLNMDIQKTFPELPQTSVEVKYVPEAMEAHLSPAFYMIPALDDTKENVIYVNKAHMNNKLTLYTTLAHEGYPGHLYIG